MKKFINIFLIMAAITGTAYAEEVIEVVPVTEVVEKETIVEDVAARRQEAIEKVKEIREKIRLEEEAAARERKRAEEEKQRELKKIEEQKKKELKQAEKIVEKQRKDLNESLELKVFRSKDKIKAADEAFKVGEDRLAFLKQEEATLKEMSEHLGLDNDQKLLGEKFDETYDKFKGNQARVKELVEENAKLKEYLKKLDAMQRRIAN